jgi:AAA domain
MQFIVIFGPPAVGKMTVGHELAQLTGFKLFHNHMAIELVLNFFPFGHPQFGTLVGEFRRRILEEVAASDLPGLIFTYVWALNDPADKVCIDEYAAIFRHRGGEVYFVELEAEQAERLKRNRTQFRLAHKPSKRDLARSEHNLLDADRRYKLNSSDDFFYQENYLKITTTSLSAAETAKAIMKGFGFRTIAVRSIKRR